MYINALKEVNQIHRASYLIFMHENSAAEIASNEAPYLKALDKFIETMEVQKQVVLDAEKEIQWLLYSNQETFLKSVVWGNFFGFIVTTAFFLVSILYVHKKKKCVKFMQVFQICYLLYLLAGVLMLAILGMFSYAFIAISTNLCSKGTELLSYKNSTISIFPEALRPLAMECFYSTSSGEIKGLMDKINQDKIQHILSVFEGQGVNRIEQNITDFDMDPPVVDNSTKIPFVNSRILYNNLIRNVIEDPITNFWSKPGMEPHNPYGKIFQINDALSCLNPKQVFAPSSGYCPSNYRISVGTDAFRDHLDKDYCIMPQTFEYNEQKVKERF